MSSQDASEITDPVLACTELGERTGGRSFEIAYDDDSLPVTWSASLMFKGGRLFVEGFPGPNSAANALAMRILDHATCVICGLTIVTANSRRLQHETGVAATVDRCLWERQGPHWIAGCVDPTEEVRRLDDVEARKRPASPTEPARRRIVRAGD